MPAALSILYATASDITAVASQAGVDLRLDDDQTDAVDSTESAYLSTQGLNYATGVCNQYLLARYLASQLALSWRVNEWCSWLGALWLAERRFNPVPESLQNRVHGGNGSRGVMDDLRDVYDFRMSLDDITEKSMV